LATLRAASVRIRIGCSGWNYDDWKGRLYPERAPRRRWLALYAATFDTVEVNATFYRLARRGAVRGWVDDTPDGFLFAVKASRYMTHVKRLAGIGDAVQRFYEPLEPLLDARRLGPTLWQLPETFHRDDARLQEWLDVLPAGMHTIEFRHESWFTPAVLQALRERKVVLAIGDHPSRPFQTYDSTGPWWFVRFHFGRRGRNGNYSSTELDEWARRIGDLRRSGEVYAYFNNDWQGFAPANAVALSSRLST
jgi:uncharacterized protein YecE (DUF72 family)